MVDLRSEFRTHHPLTSSSGQEGSYFHGSEACRYFFRGHRAFKWGDSSSAAADSE